MVLTEASYAQNARHRHTGWAWDVMDEAGCPWTARVLQDDRAVTGQSAGAHGSSEQAVRHVRASGAQAHT